MFIFQIKVVNAYFEFVLIKLVTGVFCFLLTKVKIINFIYLR